MRIPRPNRFDRLLANLGWRGQIWQLALLVVPVVVAMTACTGEVSVGGEKTNELASAEITQGIGKIVYPDSDPSVADGSVYWKRENCAQCHAADGTGVPGMCDLDLTNAERMRTRKPVDQFEAITFGKGKIYEEPVLSAGGMDENIEPKVTRTFTHLKLHDKLTKREIWNLVFYSRSLAVPLLDEKEHGQIKVVFGSNCAVCHGSRGAGDGDLNKGLVLQPAPANFNQFKRFYDRTDEQLWDHIAHGIKWEGMPNFLGKEDKSKGVKFDADYIWKLVQYVRSFHEIPQYELEKPETAASPPTTSSTSNDQKLSRRDQPDKKWFF